MADVIEALTGKTVGVCGASTRSARRASRWRSTSTCMPTCRPPPGPTTSPTPSTTACSAVVDEVVAGEQFVLLERLAERLASQVHRHRLPPRIEAVTVWVRKARPRSHSELVTSGVRLHRERPSA